MEIKLDVNAAKVRAVSAPQAVERASKPAEAKVEFKEAAALEQALRNTPEVRTEAVERGKRLVGDTAYPPRETLQRLSTLLAIKLSAES